MPFLLAYIFRLYDTKYIRQIAFDRLLVANYLFTVIAIEHHLIRTIMKDHQKPLSSNLNLLKSIQFTLNDFNLELNNEILFTRFAIGPDDSCEGFGFRSDFFHSHQF